MLKKQKQRLKELEEKRNSYRWDIEEIRHSDMDPDRKAIYINDVQYQYYIIDLEVEFLQHQIAMVPFKLMLGGFVIFVLGMIVYMAM
jgi:flagellar biosynthesis chaperone FliJ